MKHIKWKNICLVIFTFVFSSALFAVDQFDNSMLVAQQSKKSKKNNRNTKNMNRDPNTWKPYYVSTRATEPITSFYQQNVGIGFLYFSGIKGNLGETQSVAGVGPGRSLTKLQGHVGYNRTPVVEFIIGRDIWYWFKIGLSYMHQGGVVLQTAPQNLSITGTTKPDLTSDLRLDAGLFRVYFMCPWTLVWKCYYYEPYLSVGVGPSWITAADIKSEANFTNALRMKVSANCAFVIDLGAKLRRAMPTYVMSFTVGCKYMEWGALRNIGKLRDQYPSSTPVGGLNRQALTNPLRFQTIYSFIPYIGVQFNY